MNRKRGFALLAVLWIVVALGGVAARLVGEARMGSAAMTDRMLVTRARWAAEACLSVAIARLEDRLLTRVPLALAADTLQLANGTLCTSEALDPGTQVLADTSTTSMRVRLDSVLRARGDTLTMSRETLLTPYGDGRININAAPEAVLLSLPGMSDAAVRLVMAERSWQRPVLDASTLASRLPPSERALLLAQHPQLAGKLVYAPAALVVTSRGWTDGTLPVVTVEILTVPTGNRMATVRRRTW